MTDKERLEDINNFSSLPLKKRISLTKESIKKELKANDYHMPKNININTQYLLEIIKQAERVQELEEFNRILSSDKSMFIEELVREQQQNKRYREALEFYADEENYKPFDGIFLSSYQNKVDEDGGKKARQALESESK